MRRRDFLTKNVGKIALGSAMIALAEIRSAGASTPCRQITYPIAPCESVYEWCCNDGTCGNEHYTFHDNCSYYGLGPHCCG